MDIYEKMHDALNKEIKPYEKIFGTLNLNDERYLKDGHKFFISEDKVMIVRFDNAIDILREDVLDVVTETLWHTKVLDVEHKDIVEAVSVAISGVLDNNKANKTTDEIVAFYKNMSEDDFWVMMRKIVNDSTMSLVNMPWGKVAKLEEARKERERIDNLKRDLQTIICKLVEYEDKETLEKDCIEIIKDTTKETKIKKPSVNLYWNCAYCGSKVDGELQTCPHCSGQMM